MEDTSLCCSAFCISNSVLRRRKGRGNNDDDHLENKLHLEVLAGVCATVTDCLVGLPGSYSRGGALLVVGAALTTLPLTEPSPCHQNLHDLHPRVQKWWCHVCFSMGDRGRNGLLWGRDCVLHTVSCIPSSPMSSWQRFRSCL